MGCANLILSYITILNHLNVSFSRVADLLESVIDKWLRIIELFKFCEPHRS